MKLINRGLQYGVYDLGNGRVLKKVNTRKQQGQVLKEWGYTNRRKIHADAAAARKLTVTASRNIVKLLATNLHLAHLLGNPKHLRSHNYTQDRVLTLGDYMSTHSLAQNKRIIDRYIKLTHTLWTYGVADSVFNFTVNNGVHANGDVIQLDFSESDFTGKKIAAFLKKRGWRTKYSYTSLKDNPIRTYIAKRFTLEFTPKKFKALWCKNLHKAH